MKINFRVLYSCICVLVIATSSLFCVNILKEKIDKKKQKINDEAQKKQELEEKYEIDYKSNQTIRVRMSKTGEIVAMDMNDYLRGVLPSEMPPAYSIEALKAQAIVARTYTYKKIEAHGEGDDADICDDFNHCQAFYPKEKILQIWAGRGFDENLRDEYWKKVNEAVVSTENQVITYNGEYIKAFFHASSPVKTENIDQIWGGEKLAYLQSVESIESEEYPNRTSVVEVSFTDIVNKLKEDNKSRTNLSVDGAKGIKICEYTTSDRVKNIEICGYKVSAEKLRTLFGLKSTNFTMDVRENSVVFNVIGYGHGVGMSQVGADYYASIGMNCIDIIKHYYTGVEVINLGDYAKE